MKINLFACFLFMSFSHVSTAQSADAPVKVREFGIGMSNLNSYSLQFRWGNLNTLYRISGNFGGLTSFGNSTDNSVSSTSTISSKTTTPYSFNGGLNLSLLKTYWINDHLGLLYGGVMSVSYQFENSKSEASNTTYLSSGTSIQTNENKKVSQTCQPGLGLALGGVYKISPSIFLYAEVDPYVYYAFTNSTNRRTSTTINSLGTFVNVDDNPDTSKKIGISNLTNAATLTIAYRITK